MSADRELLELAAKAAGISGEWVENYGSGDYYYRGNPDGIYYEHAQGGYSVWNPLDDNGDALRLAVSLRLHIKPGKHVGDGCTVETQRPGIAGCTAFYDDKTQQMRQAIVRAATEIGKAMP